MVWASAQSEINLGLASLLWADTNKCKCNCTNQNKRLTQFERKLLPVGTLYTPRAAFSNVNYGTMKENIQ